MKTLDSFEFGAQVGRSSYDWDKILSGDIVVLVEGDDYDCKPQTLKQRARQVAAKMGKKVRTGSDKEGNIVIQAYDMTAEEKEFAKAADAKAKTKTKKAKADKIEDVDDVPEAEETKAAPRKRRAS